MSRAPKHRIGTVVSREWAARIETERRALITPEQREQQQQAAEQHKRHEAEGVTCADCDTACQFKGRDITACGDRFTPRAGVVL